MKKICVAPQWILLLFYAASYFLLLRSVASDLLEGFDIREEVKQAYVFNSIVLQTQNVIK